MYSEKKGFYRALINCISYVCIVRDRKRWCLMMTVTMNFDDGIVRTVKFDDLYLHLKRINEAHAPIPTVSM